MKTAAERASIPVLVLLLTAACSSDWGMGVDVSFCKDGYIQPTTMQVSPSSMTLRAGQTETVRIIRSSPRETESTCYDLPSWQSSDYSVATARGFEVTGLRPGTAQLTATSGPVSVTITVNVSSVQIATLTITAPRSLLVGQVAQATLTARDSDGNEIAIIGKPVWSSSDESIMTVSETGAITARASGSVIIRAIAEGREGSATISITRSQGAVKFTAISAGFQHTCGIAGGGAVPQGSIICWGNIFGEYRLAPSWMITGGRTFRTIDAGFFHSCAIATTGDTFCWGRNTNGQIGDGTTSTRTDPTRVSTALVFANIAVGEAFTCGLSGEGVTYCWGVLAGRSSTAPTELYGAPRFHQITAERYMVCGLTDGGDVYCIGTGQEVSYQSFTKITSPVAFASINSSDYHTCGLTSGGAVYCWGLNSGGQIGPGPILVKSPAILPGGLSFSSISPGASSTCGITANGAVCLGATSLAGATMGSFYPIPGQYSRPMQMISNGTTHGCAIDNDGAAWCWGSNFEGQVGAGGNQVFSEPVLILADPLG